MDGMDEIKKDLEEKGYYIGDGFGIIVGSTSQEIHKVSLIDDTIRQWYDSLEPMCERAVEFSRELISTVNEVLPEIMQRAPGAIKRDIKHEKNPMRLKQLNRELNMSYKFWRKK